MKGQKQLEELHSYIKQYYESDLSDGVELNQILQKVTSLLYTLENLRSEMHDKHQTIIFNLVKEGNSVASSVNQANVEVPQMYQLRRIMDAAYEVVGAIRTNISYLKQEMANIHG